MKFNLLTTPRFLVVAACVGIIAAHSLLSFCGFYAAKADISLLNKSSQVILVRDGEHTVITMLNDFKGDAKDFALIVPVPEVMKRENIKTVRRDLFDKLEAYSTPRLAEYYDPHPCRRIEVTSLSMSDSYRGARSKEVHARVNSMDLGVKIEARYTVGEYDIVVLSAEQSGGLATWLTQNGYKIPPKAPAVLEPYVKTGMKFFVAKVKLDELPKTGFEYLSPLQITINSPKFMLPIRLGMANSDGDQDLIIYTFSKRGRIESSNYRTVLMPTDKDIPLFVKPEFGQFYNQVFDRQYKKKGKNVVFVEYAWNLSMNNSIKCDPCPTPPPDYSVVQQAGVEWYATAPTYFTRLHVRYNRETFPQDLAFIETANMQNYQARYVVHIPASIAGNIGDKSCDEPIRKYVADLHERRENELDNYESLTGFDADRYDYYPAEYDKLIKK